MTAFVALRQITLPEGRKDDRDGLVAALTDAAGTLPGVQSCWIAPVSPVAVINAGDIVWRMTFATEGEALSVQSDPAWNSIIAPLLAGMAVTHLGYRIAHRHVRRAGAGIWRALIFRCFPHADPEQVRALQEATLLLPGSIEPIRGWALSPIAYCDGAKAFEYIWEQEFDGIEYLTGPYMAAPLHWGLVDAFFDADCPEYIVDPHLIQIVGAIQKTVL